MAILQCGRYPLALDRPLVMGIVNLTPDSFSGDGLLGDVDCAIAHARRQWEAGADILDVGAESSRPGAQPTPLAEERARLLPVLEELSSWNVPVSIDTYKPEIMELALRAGASMINDITGMTNPAALQLAAGSDCAVCYMHMQGEPRSMQVAPAYGDVVGEVGQYLRAGAERCMAHGIARERLVADPGFGFGKSLAHNLALLQRLECLAPEGVPLLVGVSRKSMLGLITGRPVAERQAASVVAAALAAERGAGILRVHDVAATCDALKIVAALLAQGE